MKKKIFWLIPLIILANNSFGIFSNPIESSQKLSSPSSLKEINVQSNLNEGCYFYNKNIEAHFTTENTDVEIENSRPITIKINGTEINFVLSLQNKELFYVTFKKENSFSLTYYFYRYENYYSISTKTGDYTKSLLYEFLYKENKLTYEEKRLLDNEMSEETITKIPFILPYSSTEGIKGKISRKYNGKTYPLKNTKVGLYWHRHRELINHLDYAYTDEDGNFTFNINYDEFDFNRGIYLHIYSENKFVYVANDMGNYKYDEDFKSEVQNKQFINFLIDVGTTSTKNLSDKAASILISQHLLLAGEYADSLTTKNLDLIKVIYPGDGTFYSHNKFISIGGSSRDSDTFDPYKNPDSTIHEYGHYLQHIFDFTDSPAIDHYYDFNSCELIKGMASYFGTNRYDEDFFVLDEEEAKEKGIKLSWAEGWATYFSIICGKNKMEEFEDLPYLGDDYYIFDNKSQQNVYNKPNYGGEGNESNITAFLLNLNKNLNINHKKLFEIPSQNKITTLNSFYLKLLSTYSSLENEINKYMSLYHIAPYSISKSGNKISWKAGGASEIHFPNDTFTINFLDSNDRQLFNKTVYQTSYTLTQSDLSKLTSSFKISITGSSDDYYQNGKYTSEIVQFNK